MFTSIMVKQGHSDLGLGYRILYKSFNFAKSFMPMKYWITDIYDESLAKMYGFVSGFWIAEAGKEWVYPYVLKPLFDAMGQSSSIDDVIATSLMSTMAVYFANKSAYKILGSDDLKNFEKEDPVFTAGTNSVIQGASIAALLELIR